MLVEELIQKAAFSMFRDWCEKAIHRFPNLNFTINDESLLVDDLTKTIRAAANSIFKSEHDEKRKITGWSINFMYGFIESNLSYHWYYEYIQKQTDNYKYFIAIKAILDYLKFDSDLSFKFDLLYKELFKSTNLDQIKLSSNIDIPFLHKYGLKPKSSEDKLVEFALESLELQLIKMNSETEYSFEINPEKYFSEDDILFFINYYSPDTSENQK